MKLALEVGQLKFGDITFDWEDKAILLGWVAKIWAGNLIWVRIIAVRLGWPPIKLLSWTSGGATIAASTGLEQLVTISPLHIFIGLHGCLSSASERRQR